MTYFRPHIFSRIILEHPSIIAQKNKLPKTFRFVCDGDCDPMPMGKPKWTTGALQATRGVNFSYPHVTIKVNKSFVQVKESVQLAWF